MINERAGGLGGGAVHLTKRVPEKNQQRFYRIHVCAGVFGDWAVVREWGRIGSPGTVRKDWFDREEEAIIAREKLREAKQKKGYRLVLTNFDYINKCHT